MQFRCLIVLVLVVLPCIPVVEVAAQLPPEMQADRYLLEAERHIGNGDHTAAKSSLDRILELQGEHDVALPEAFWFRHAQVALQGGRYAEAVESVTQYLKTAGREGAHYRAALELLDRAEAGPPREVRNSIGMEFVLIEPGTFQMGSPATEPGRSKFEGPVHEVIISQPFYLGKYEVTQGQWQAVMRSNPSRFSNCGAKCPVEVVSWGDAQRFIEALNRSEGMGRYRLPTEAEWEYAARAGTQTALYTGRLETGTIRGDYNSPATDRVGWYVGNSGVSYPGGYACDRVRGKQYPSSWCGTHPVGGKLPNAWGLYDMLGNVSEWVQDCFHWDYTGAPTDGRAWESGDCSMGGVMRGGSWLSAWGYLRLARRGGGDSKDFKDLDVGFRIARSLP